MYSDAPVSSHAEIVAALQARQIDLTLIKTDKTAILNEAHPHSRWVFALFPLQFLLPLCFIIPYALLTRHYWGLIAVLPYLAIPILFPFNALVGILATAAGLFCIELGWPGVVICLLAPAFLSYWGEQIWWGVVQVTVLRQVLRSEETFLSLWKNGSIAIKTAKKLYRYNPANHPNAEEAQHPAPAEAKEGSKDDES